MYHWQFTAGLEISTSHRAMTGNKLPLTGKISFLPVKLTARSRLVGCEEKYTRRLRSKEQVRNVLSDNKSGSLGSALAAKWRTIIRSATYYCLQVYTNAGIQTFCNTTRLLNCSLALRLTYFSSQTTSRSCC